MLRPVGRRLSALMTERPRVVVVAALPAAGLKPLSERFTVEAAGTESGQAWLRGHAAGADAIVADPGIPVDEALLNSLGSSLKVVANFGVGHDNVDLEAARVRGVRVTNTPGVLTNATAELAVALILACGRRMAEADAMIRRGDWARSEHGVARTRAGRSNRRTRGLRAHRPAGWWRCCAASRCDCWWPRALAPRYRAGWSGASSRTCWRRRSS